MDTEREKHLRAQRCCFTGHRPEKLNRAAENIKLDLEKEIQFAVAAGYRTFISGMARGTDLWAAEIVIRLRNEGLPLHLICACPYEGFEQSWKLQWQELYRSVLEQADLVRYISAGYHRACFQRRNEWMVQRSSRVIAVYNGTAGGTRNTILFAERENVMVRVIDG